MTKDNGTNPIVGGYLEDISQVLSGIDASRVNIMDLVKHDLVELWRLMLWHRMPFDFLRAAIDTLPAKDYHREGNPKVFLRHGYLTGAACWRGLGAVLEPSWGINSHQYDYTASLEVLTERFLRKVEEDKQAKDRVIHAVGHSKGALMILGAYQRRPDLFDRIVTIAPPFYGSTMAERYRFIDSLWQLRPDSESIKRLSTTPIPTTGQILNLYTEDDEFIHPGQNSRLPEQNNITNLRFPGFKHNSFLYDPLVHGIVRLFLEGANFDGESIEAISYEFAPRERDRMLRINDANFG